MKNFILLLIVIFTFNSCIFRHEDDTVDLENNYYFLPDGRMSNIGYNTAKEGENRSGTRMVEPKVVKYNFNENFIIAKSIGVYDNEIRYWIIDKNLTEKEISKSMDSITFYRTLIEKRIDLKLNE